MSVFSSLIDQSEVVAILKEAVQSARNKEDLTQGMTNTWLFTGPPGSGRSNAAIAFAAALVCKDSGCSKCNDCMSTIIGTHADVELTNHHLHQLFSLQHFQMELHLSRDDLMGKQLQCIGH